MEMLKEKRVVNKTTERKRKHERLTKEQHCDLKAK